MQDWDGSVGVHWLQGTILLDRVERVCRLICDYWDLPEASRNDWGRYRYDRSYVWEPYNICVYFDSSVDRSALVHRGRATVVIPGAALDLLDGERLYSFIRELHGVGFFTATRIDVCFDDYAREVNPYEVAEECKLGNFTRFKRWEHRSPCNRQGVREADLVTFGRRGKGGGGAYLRCYDKGLESGGERDAVRWEVEFSKERAQVVAFKLGYGCDNVAEFAATLGALIGGVIDFVDRKGKRERNLNRLRRLDWWERIAAVLGRCRLRNAVRERSLERTEAWVGGVLQVTLWMLREKDGPEAFGAWLEDVLAGAPDRVTSRHEALLREYWRWYGGTRGEVPF